MSFNTYNIYELEEKLIKELKQALSADPYADEYTIPIDYPDIYIEETLRKLKEKFDKLEEKDPDYLPGDNSLPDDEEDWPLGDSIFGID